ncbi:MAG: indolepyruvate ferredoxin oxidoreductase family protein [Acidimicrobiia bacterium]|nr:indolepyruvate ferredoxin oxidoreductase family protein [Acidimicrobiia bacterium]
MALTGMATEITVTMTGLQALLQVTAHQQQADAARGLRTAGLIAGYRGSPLAGVDQAYERKRAELEAANVSFISGVNEDLAATMIWGSQLAHLEDDCRYDGVFGLWYGKGPGIDRSVDALRHANLAGVDPNGGVLTVVGDDPACKSSTIPSASEGVLSDLAMPTLYPGSVQEVLDMGRWGYELSRYSGSWVGFKIHTDVADQYATVQSDPTRIGPLSTPEGDWAADQHPMLIAPYSVNAEAQTFSRRLDAARSFVAHNNFDKTLGAAGQLGIVAAGKAFADVMSVLRELGIDGEDALAEAGIRVWKPAMIWPLEPAGLASFATGLDEILVVEEKRPFIESQIRDLLYDLPSRPRISGKKAPGGADLLPVDGALTADRVRPALISRIEAVLPTVALQKPRQRIALIAGESADLAARTPYFCSGCPHNRSTVVPEGSVAGGGIGCHTMASFMNRGQDWHTHMGGEGAQWAGMSRFVGTEHRFQNIGDGTLFHSGSLAIRQAVSAGANMTYKILYNGTVAMTGGQDAAGNMPIPALTQMLEAEGVVKTVVVNDDGHSYDKRLAANARTASRDDFDTVQRDLRDTPGVTAIVYDQRCAAELRRDRKRDRVETPTKRIYINEAVCDGCGDCGRVSNCMSVHPVETAFGRKTRIHQESCNFDYSCVNGNCPAFLEVDIDPTFKRHEVGLISLPEGATLPAPVVLDDAAILIVGIGGTGVVTVSQVLSTAALSDGKHAASLDQTGLAQKGGQVISNLKISSVDRNATARVGENEADTMLVFDVIGGTSTDVLSRARQGRTSAVVSSVLLPTGMTVREVDRQLPELDAFRRSVESVMAPGATTWLDAEGIAKRVFGSQPAANFLVVGLASQQGLLPVSAESIEGAITKNGVAVSMNIEAFRLGRRLAVEPDLLERVEGFGVEAPATPQPQLNPSARRLIERIDGPEALLELVEIRVPELIEHTDLDYAASYIEAVERCRAAETTHGSSSELSEIVAFQLFKLMAYKDEYEVARLHLRSDLRGEIEAQFGPEAKFSFLLEPPTLKKLGRAKKTRIPERAGQKLFEGLRRGKKARGTKLDPFGRTEERRIERELIAEYRNLVDRILASLTIDNAGEAARILQLADQVRGFDTVKLENVARYRAEVAEALEHFD